LEDRQPDLITYQHALCLGRICFGLTSYKFNAFHTVMLKMNLLETVKHNRYIGHRLQGVRIKFNRTTFFGQLRSSSGP